MYWFWISDEGVPSETEEERKLEAAKAARIKELTSRFINKVFYRNIILFNCCFIITLTYEFHLIRSVAWKRSLCGSAVRRQDAYYYWSNGDSYLLFSACYQWKKKISH